MKTLSSYYTFVKLFTDSLSNIRAIGSRNKQPSVVIKNQLLALELGEKLQLSIEWVPGHQGFEGNDVADKLAKATSFFKNYVILY